MMARQSLASKDATKALSYVEAALAPPRRKSRSGQSWGAILGGQRRRDENLIGGHFMAKKLSILAALVLGLLALGSRSSALQKEGWEIQRLFEDLASHRQPPNTTEFVFARIQFTSNGPGRRNYGGARACMTDSASYGSFRVCGWAHDYPAAEQNLNQIVREATGINVTKDSYEIVRLDSEELFRYPWGLMSEVGEMTLTDKEAANFREYLNRGGFIVVDDFDGPNLEWFQEQMKKVFPDRQFVPLTVDNPLFHTFYDVKTLEMEPPYPQRGTPKFYGYLDDHGRVAMILNHNNDIGDFWEWVDEPRYDLKASVAGLQLGINYIIYSLTH